MRLKYLNLWELLFPPQLRAGLLRRSLTVIGTALLTGGVGLGLALVSWSAADPSLSHATDATVTNWLGWPGAAVSDLMIQFFGIGSAALVLTVAGWGWHLAASSPLTRPLRRAICAILATALIGGFASSLPAPDTWPLVAGMGGVVGDATAGVLAAPLTLVAGALGPEAEAVLAALIAPFAAVVLAYASGISLTGSVRAMRRRAGRADDRPPSSLPVAILAGIGMAAWWLVVRLARLVRWLWRRVAGPRPVDPQERLRIAMARAEDDDLVWARPGRGEDTCGGPLDRPGAYEMIASPGLARRVATGARELVRRLLDTEDEHLPARAGDRAEPHFEEVPGPGRTATLEGAPPAPGPDRKARSAKRVRRPVVPELDFDDDAEYQLPPLSLLNEAPPARPEDALTSEMLEENARLLEGVLDDFGVRGQIINVRPGPVVTLYELEPAPGLKSSRVIGLADDIARSMSAISARVAVVPGRNVIGIELPNDHRQTVFLHEVIASRAFASGKHALALTLGKTIGGEPVIADLARMPHLLIAGTTGSGKSVGINAMILSILFRMTPDQCKLIMIDPKMLELSVYDGIPHLLSPVVTDPRKAIVALKWTVREMEARYKNMSKVGVRNIDGFNKRVREAASRGEVLTRTIQTGFDRETGEAVYETEEMSLEPMPFIVVVVDEMADLMMVAGKDIEGAIQRLAQMARAAGIHIIMATQRPSVDVITGTIKANFPTRVSFQVTSKIDSRTILGEQGAEQLLGQGDMLYMAGGGRISRVHGAFVSDEEVETVVQFLKRQGVPEYLDAVTADTDDGGGAPGDDFFSVTGGESESESDTLYDQAVAIVARDRKASTSYIQRRLSIGYNRAATIIERMEEEGVVGPANHAGKREILVPEPSFDDV